MNASLTFVAASVAGTTLLIAAIVAFAVLVVLAMRARGRSITQRPYASPYTDAPGARSES